MMVWTERGKIVTPLHPPPRNFWKGRREFFVGGQERWWGGEKTVMRGVREGGEGRQDAGVEKDAKVPLRPNPLPLFTTIPCSFSLMREMLARLTGRNF
ncbi:hypothetical protein CEXT_542961 [Caerostris extrusa]|uniref:Uncharacterized protein n=1 Tax=Caerostris extrusa TaxID=172846 RepID=A0AAV4NLV6_CAEEX|nr:hypothetical protein CEXT_542961 [Caerostris extrusa]